MAAGPAVPGLRKKPEITIGSGNGMISPTARTHVTGM
jgi:hypothetical protein